MTSHRHEVDGISYLDVGSGPAVVFVHGVFTSGLLWRNCVRLLSGHRRCIVIDLPGHGHTPPIGEATVWGLADAVGTVIRALDLRDITLVGNDTGGAVAQVVLTRDPSRFSHFVLTNCDTEGNFPPPAFKPAVFAARARLLRIAGPLVRFPWLAKQIYRVGYQNPGSLPDEVITSYLTPILSASATRFMERLLASMTPHQLADIRPQLRSCSVPTLLAWGTGDLFFKMEWAHWLQRLIPGASEVVEITGGRLFYVDERAADLVAALENHWRP